MSAGELSREAGLTSGAITAVIDRLERLGYVQRIADPKDRRRVLVELTDKAKRTSEELFGPLGDQLGPMLARYSDDELRLVTEFHRWAGKCRRATRSWLRERLRERGT
jgi:DNA-binding MarR family transcriptional regulator